VPEPEIVGRLPAELVTIGPGRSPGLFPMLGLPDR
jgi:hypothetical protein